MALKDTCFVVLYIISINNVRKMSTKVSQSAGFFSIRYKKKFPKNVVVTHTIPRKSSPMPNIPLKSLQKDFARSLSQELNLCPGRRRFRKCGWKKKGR